MKSRLKSWWNTTWIPVFHDDDSPEPLQPQACLVISEGKLSLATIPLDILIDANRFTVHVEHGRVQIKASVKPKKS